MEISAKKIDSANAEISAKIDKKELENKIDELAKKTSKQISMPGFRQGKVPVDVVLSKYKDQINNDAKSEIFKSVIDEGLKQLNKEPKDLLSDPIFSKYEENDNEIVATLDLAFRPDIKLDGYEKFIPEYKQVEVTQKEVDERVNEFLKMLAPLEKIEKDMLEKGDFAKFDFEGFIDDKAFEGGAAKNHILEIGSGQFIPGFEDQMVGMKAGESRDIKVKFPDDYHASNLAGKDAVFKVTLHEIQGKKEAKLDSDMLKKLLPGKENPTKEEFEKRIKSDIENEKFQAMLLNDLKPKFADALVENFSFDLPKVIIEQEIDMRLRNAYKNFTKEEQEALKDPEKLKAKREEFKEEAKKSVTITFIIDELAKLRNINVSDQEILQAIYMEGYRYGIDPKKHLEYYQQNGMIPAIKMALVEEKLFNDIFKKEEK